ncbi:DJ-1/PfpI family protein [Mucilaginibacter pineti]|uniref:DJ-1/PfpI family protein n=1 Tax=Mucilaginibacter pineti TaxID=1391627 RepID=A0A1G7NRG9_9SPHI|nr:DJ-1/PfpI family protein [Mucilaginibacter pineti]SDF76675.1 DJ-1/PfpI family protein [Mucilaginibacter pineti]
MKNQYFSRRKFITATTALAAFSSMSFATNNKPLNAVRTEGSEREGLLPEKMTVGMVVFEGFQLLDTFGPLEMFGSLRDEVQIVIIGEKKGAVKSSAGPAVVVEYDFADAPKLDIVMIPGGGGTRREVNNPVFISAFKLLAQATPHVASICTGAAVLARTGLLDGVKATTNKRAFKWATSQGPNVKWIAQARWVEDGRFFTSSGISAGTDMALALIARLFGQDTAVRIANGAEYGWNNDPHHDPFAKLNGLVD